MAKYICPLLTVENIEVSKDFYMNLLGQQIKFDFGANVTFQGDFAIHLKSHYSGLIDNKPVTSGGNDFELYFELDDLEGLVRQLKEKSIEFVHPVKEQPWQQKVVRFYDPDKHIIEVGETMEFLVSRLGKEGKTAEDISTITMLPIEFINNYIDGSKI